MWKQLESIFSYTQPNFNLHSQWQSMGLSTDPVTGISWMEMASFSTPISRGIIFYLKCQSCAQGALLTLHINAGLAQQSPPLSLSLCPIERMHWTSRVHMKYVCGVKRVTKPSSTLYVIVCSAYCACTTCVMLAWLDRQADQRQHNTLNFLRTQFNSGENTYLRFES